jgi:transposase
MREQGMFDPARLVFIDETSANTKMVRLYGRRARGERLVGHVPQGHWKTITFVAALRRHGLRASQTIDGAMTGKKFLAYVEQCLAATLKRKDIVMIDNLQAHKAGGVREAIEARGAQLRYLPKYSPDLSPIEMPFSNLKADLTKPPRGQFRACAAASAASQPPLRPAKPPITSGTLATRRIHRNLL